MGGFDPTSRSLARLPDHETIGQSVDQSFGNGYADPVMPRQSGTATTRLPGTSGPHDRRLLFSRGEEIESPETRLRYRFDGLLGQGGFGQAFLARRIGPSKTVPP